MDEINFKDATMLPLDDIETLRRFGYKATDVGVRSHLKVIICCTVCKMLAPRKRRAVAVDSKCRRCSASDPALIAKKKASIKRRFGETGLKGLKRKKTRADPNRKALVRCSVCGNEFLRHYKKANKPIWRCARCAGRSVASTRVYSYTGLPIDAEATFKTFGHRPEWLKPTSNRKVIIRCTVCSKKASRIRQSVTSDAKCLHCRFSDPVMVEKKRATLLKNLGPNAQSIICERRAATIRERYDETPFVWTVRAESKAERSIKALIEGVLGEESVTKKIMTGGLHIDVYVAAKHVGVEHHGLFYHHELSLQPRGPAYHARKLREARVDGIRLIQVFEDEWRDRRAAVEQIILSALGVYGRRIGARKCDARTISVEEARIFMRALHLQGASRRAIAARGLFYNNELVGAATLAHHHRQIADGLVLDRLCFGRGVQVVGGASRLVAGLAIDAIQLGAKQLITWSDNRWSEGDVYKKLGFQKDLELAPDYQYVVVAEPNDRLSKQSQKKSSTKCPSGLTEHEWALNRGLARIWDCGKVRWVRELT